MMPAVQRTFSLVPTNLNNSARKPAMTSKAAKKAYLQANRGPRVSRAEQRRLEQEELDRQKKGYEKERNAAKAKSIREKKAAKFAEEKEERRKLGLPEPSRFVRASQPTISMFARTGVKRTWQEMDLDNVAEDSEDTMVEEVMPLVLSGKQPSKRVAIEQESEDEFGDFPSMTQISQTDILQKIDSSNPRIEDNNNLQKLSFKLAREPSNLEFGEFPSLSQSDILQKLQSSHASVSKICKADSQPPKLAKQISELKPVGLSGISKTDILEAKASQLGSLLQGRNTASSEDRSQEGNSQELPAHKSASASHESPYNTQILAELVTTQIHSEAAEAEARSDGVEVPAVQDETPNVMTATITITEPLSQRRSKRTAINQEHRSPTTVGSFKRQTPKNHSAGHSPLITDDSRHSNAMLPPRQVSTRKSVKERSINMPPPPKPLQSKAPTPSTSALRRSRPLAQQLSAKRFVAPVRQYPPSSTQLFLENNLDDFLPSPSQEIRELLEDVDDFPSNTQIMEELSPAKPIRPLIINKDDSYGDLFCTQDFAMSSQEISEIITPSRLPVTRASNTKSLVAKAQKPRIATRYIRPPAPTPTIPGNTTIATPPTVAPQVARQRYAVPPVVARPSARKVTSSLPGRMSNTVEPVKASPKRTDHDNHEADITPGIVPRRSVKNTTRKSPPTDVLLTNLVQRVPRQQDDVKPHKIISRVPDNPLGSSPPELIPSHIHTRSATRLLSQQNNPKSPPPIPPKIALPLPPKGRFFVEKEDDIFHAVLDESKRQATAEEKARLAAQVKPLPLTETSNNATKRSKRNFQRVESTTTDYGDDDFLSSQDLRAFC